MADLPTGTVTFLFTDIEGSTKLLHELGAEQYALALARHRAVLRDAFGAHGGVEVDTEGDAFFVAFPDAADAIAAAGDAQHALGDGSIRVRMGIHTGTPHRTEDGYVGADVHLGARIAAAGHGGQVLISKATAEAVGGSVHVIDLGEHRLKDFAQAISIFQLGSEPFPPLKTISNTNLPRPASSFVGREREVADVTALLRNGARLLTLTGPGGTGKSRLSIEAAAELVPEFKAGVFWVPLAAVRDPSLVIEAISRTVGAKESLTDHIGERDMLLIVDNLEQVIAAAPELATLVESCPKLRVLITSRELLRVRGEVEYAVPALANREAAELFTTRSGLPADETVLALCRRLERLPLAVELAAARARVLTPKQILDRLSDRLDLLKGGRDADPRQGTLRGAIDWSYELLQADEKRLFGRMAVFSGGATLEAAETVVDADLDDLQSLVDKSLVRHSGNRFWMLETIHDYALERLDESEDADRLRRRHAAYFLELAEGLEESMFGPGSDVVNDRVEVDHGNYRAALDHFEANGDIQAAMRLAGALTGFWDARAHHREALARYRALLSASDDTATEARAKVLDGAAKMALMTGDLTTARSLQVGALEITRRLENKPGVALALWGLGYISTEDGRYDEAAEFLNQALQMLRELDDTLSIMWITRTLAHNYMELGDLESAQPLYEESRDRAHAAGDRLLEGHTTGALATIAAVQQRPRDAAGLARESLQLIRDAGDPSVVLARLTTAADVLLRIGQADISAQLIAYGEARHEEIGAEEPWVAKLKQEVVEALRDRVDKNALADAWRVGRALSPDEAFALAMAALERAAAGHAGRSRGETTLPDAV